MEIRNLGASGLRVSAVGLGCNNFGQRTDLETSRKVIHRALDLGITLFDTADIYAGMVHLLEERLGVALFERKANRLVLTQAGRAYQSGLTPIFDALASLTAQVTAPASVRVLTIGVGHTFAMRWLIPRLSEFRSEEPDIEVRFTTGGASVPFGEDWNCGIKLGTGDWPGLVAEPLFAGDLTPVCVPRLASGLKRPADLKGPSLIRVAHSPEDWPIWLKAAGVPRINARGPEFQFYGQALQAAADGLGIAMNLALRRRVIRSGTSL